MRCTPRCSTGPGPGPVVEALGQCHFINQVSLPDSHAILYFGTEQHKASHVKSKSLHQERYKYFFSTLRNINCSCWLFSLKEEMAMIFRPDYSDDFRPGVQTMGSPLYADSCPWQFSAVGSTLGTEQAEPVNLINADRKAA